MLRHVVPMKRLKTSLSTSNSRLNFVTYHSRSFMTEPESLRNIKRFEVTAYYPFKYEDKALPFTSVQHVKRVKSQMYNDILFEEQLVERKVSSIPPLSIQNSASTNKDKNKDLLEAMKNGTIRGIEVPTPIFVGNNEHKAFLKTLRVGFFQNNIGIASATFISDLVQEPNTSGEPVSELKQRTLQALLDLQWTVSEPVKFGIECAAVGVIADKEEAVPTGDIYSTTITDFFQILLNHQCNNRWSELCQEGKPFLFSRIILHKIPTLAEIVDEESTESAIKKITMLRLTDKNKPTNDNDYDEENWSYTYLTSLLYATTRVTSTLSLKLQPSTLEDFRDEDCYLEWASHSGGLWMGMSGLGGSLIYHENDHNIVNTVQTKGLRARTQRKLRRQTLGPSNAELEFPAESDLVAQLVQPLIYEWAYLQSELDEVRDLILRTRLEANLLEKQSIVQKLKSQEGRLLRFSLLTCDRIGTDEAANDIFEIWRRKFMIHKLKEDTTDFIRQLADFYADISAAEQRRKLDALTGVVGGFGLAQLLVMIATSDSPAVAYAISCVACVAALATFRIVVDDQTINEMKPLSSKEKKQLLIRRLIKGAAGTTMIAGLGLFFYFIELSKKYGALQPKDPIDVEDSLIDE